MAMTSQITHSNRHAYFNKVPLVQLARISLVLLTGGAAEQVAQDQRQQANDLAHDLSRARAELANSEAERARLAAELAILKAARADTSKQEQDAPRTERRSGEERRADGASTRQRDTLLILIAALAEMAGLDWRTPHAAGATLESKTQELGARVSENGVAGHLKRIPAVLEAFPEVVKLIPEALRRRSK